MQYFDLNRALYTQHLDPCYRLEDLAEQDWQLAKIRVEYDCLQPQQELQGQVVLRSSKGVTVEVDWILKDNGQAIELHFQGFDNTARSTIKVQGAQLVDEQQQPVSASSVQLWLDGVLDAMHTEIERTVKEYLNIWDYVSDYD